MKSSPLWKSISCLLLQVVQGKGKAAKRCHLVSSPTPSSLRLVSGVYHPSHHTAAFPETVLLLSETGGVHVSPLTGLPMEVFQAPGLSLPHGRPLPWRCSRPAVPPVRHPAVASSKALACISRAVYGQIFHFSFIIPACTVT